MIQRATDYTLIADTAANKEAIATMKEDVSDLKQEVHEIRKDLDAVRDEQREGHNAIIARLDANQNQILGASKMAKLLWFLFPAASAAVGWLAGKLS